MGLGGPNSCLTSRHGIEYEMQRTPGGDADTYYKENWTPQLVNASFVARVAWNDGNTFILDMLGEHTRAGVGLINRNNPEQHPFFPSLYCVGVETVRNLGVLTYDATANNAVQYEEVEYLCTFAAMPYRVLENADVWGLGAGAESYRYVERRSELVGQSIQANGAFEFGSPNAYPTPNDPIPTPPAIHVPYTKLMLIWHYVPDPITVTETSCEALYGTVNDAGFEGKSAGTLMYLGYQKEFIPSTPAGNWLWKITHNLAYFPSGWNRAYRPNGPSDAAPWDSVRNRATGNPPYASATFTNMFLI